jgi:hypothetical protein
MKPEFRDSPIIDIALLQFAYFSWAVCNFLRRPSLSLEQPPESNSTVAEEPITPIPDPPQLTR